MYDVGDTYPATAEVRDSSGTPVSATAMAFTFLLPDGTTETPAPSNPSTGIYTFDYPIAQHGLYRFRAVSTGPDTAYADAFNVVDSTWPAFVGLAEVKDHLNIAATNTTHDDELRGFILSAGEVVEDIVGAVARRTVTETYSGRGDQALALRKHPAISITSVTENGQLLDPSGYWLSDAGLLYRRSGYSPMRWPHGVGNVVVTYEVGRAAAPWSVLDATKELIRVNWRPQQGGNFSPFDSGGVDTGQGEVRLGFFVPNTVMQRLQPSARGPLVA